MALAETRRLQWVDMAKGLSILLVVMMHSAFGVGEETGGTGFLHWIIAFATPFRMPEFFLISGLFLSYAIGRDWKRFADRRVVHYLYFYGLWAIIQIVFKVGLGAGDPLTALANIAWAIVEPFGVLWFIYMLAVFSAAAKLVHDLRVPHWAVLLVGAVLQMLHLDIGVGIVDEFAAYFVYFYAGYALAPSIFKLIEWVDRNAILALAGLAVWAVVEALLVFSPGFQVLPGQIIMGIAALPGVRLILAVVGTVALCTIAALLTKLAFMNWLRWLGSKSIVVYLSFTLPMAVMREILLRTGVITNTGAISAIVMVAAVVSPLVLYWIIQRTGWGRFLFERPAWAHIPGTPGARDPADSTAKVAAQ